MEHLSLKQFKVSSDVARQCHCEARFPWSVPITAIDRALDNFSPERFPLEAR